MELALYHSKGGYYTNSSVFGAQGDYFTSPAAHPAFGALIATQLNRMWEILDCPSQFFAIDMGSGNGLLSRDVVGYAAATFPAFVSSLNYLNLEQYVASREAPNRFSNIHSIITSDVPLKGVVGCFISNEIVDSFPVHRFQIQQGEIKEIYVALDETGRFIEVLGLPSTPLITQRLSSLDFSLPNGYQGEICLYIHPWMNKVSEALNRGFVVTIDYGFEAKELYALKRSGGTIQTHYRHIKGASPYQLIGSQDITTHVDFSSVASVGNSLGLRSVGLTTQSQFLKLLGIDVMMESLREKQLSNQQRESNMMAMIELTKAEGLGGFKVLVQERGTGVTNFNELVPTTPFGGSVVPLLRSDHMNLIEGRYPHLGWDPQDLWPFNPC